MRIAQTSVLGILAGLACTSAAFAQDSLQRYTEWKYEAPKQRYTCEYHFRPSVNAGWKKQQVVHYSQPEKRNWVYFYNPEKQVYWGRCASQAHPHYNNSQMQWSYQKNNQWGELTPSCPFIPGQDSGPELLSPPPPPGL